MQEYDIYYSDGNHRILAADDIYNLMNYLITEPEYDNNTFIKIELRGLTNNK